LLKAVMELLHARCAGLDVHATNVVACVRIADSRAVTYEYRTVPTTTRGLLELADWLTAHACTHVVLESTGVYRRFPRSEMLQQSGMRLRSFCPENRMTCDGRVDRFILPRGELSKGF